MQKNVIKLLTVLPLILLIPSVSASYEEGLKAAEKEVQQQMSQIKGVMQALMQPIAEQDEALEEALVHTIAGIAKQVYAIEMQPDLLTGFAFLPANLTVLCADARSVPWPENITLGVLLMRHCTHVQLYASRLRAVGCRRLVTNARWGLDVELVELGQRAAWNSVNTGWYACTCGQTGFVPGPPEQLTEDRLEQIAEVENCPACDSRLARQPIG